MRKPAGVARLSLWLALVGGAQGVLAAAGRGVLSGPALTSPPGWQAWLAGRPPAAAAFALLRLAGLAMGWYLLAVTGLGLVTRLAALTLRSPHAVAALGRAVEVLALPAWRSALGLGVGATVAAVVTAGSPVAAAGRVAASPAVTAFSPCPQASAEQEADSMCRLDGPGPAPPQPPQRASSAAAATWTVGPGDSFWAVARRHVTARLDRAAVAAEVAPYWLALIEANGDRLLHGRDPDLIYPGQELVLPPEPGA